MKVENSGLNRINRPDVEGAYPLDKASRSAETSASEELSGKDRASVSERARLLAKARVSLNETSDVRPEKVDTLREQIETGNYQVPHEEIVKRLMSQFRQS